MPYLVAVLGFAIKTLAGYLVARVLLALGITYVTYTGMSALFDTVTAEIQGTYLAMGADVVNFVTLCGADVAISILLSAVSIRLLLSGWVAGAITTYAFKNSLE